MQAHCLLIALVAITVSHSCSALSTPCPITLSLPLPPPTQAAGSSLLVKLTHCLAADALLLAGMCDLGPVTVLPLATGMALTMTLLALPSITVGGGGMGGAGNAGRSGGGCGSEERSGDRGGVRSRVLWSRIDQKTCLKAITAAGLEPVVIELLKQGDELVTDVEVCLLND